MNYKTKIYISQISNLSVARYAAGMMVDYIGFPLDAGLENRISTGELEGILSWIEGIDMVAEFNNAELDTINDYVDKYHFKYVSIPIQRFSETANIHCPVILRTNDLTHIDHSIYVDESESPPTLIDYTGDVTNDIKNNDQLLLLSKSFISNHRQIDQINPFGIKIIAGTEERPGYQDYDEIADILEEIEI